MSKNTLEKSPEAALEEITKPSKRIRIMIQATGDKRRGRDEVVAVNGVAYQIQRGVPVDVPPEVVAVLQNAIETRYEEVQDPSVFGGSKIVSYEAQAIPFSILG